MLGYFKFAIVAFLMLSAASAAVMDAKIQPVTSSGGMSERLLRLEAEMKAMTRLREVERGLALNLRRRFVANDICIPAGNRCPGSAPEMCCSGSCVIPHPFARSFVCE